MTLNRFLLRVPAWLFTTLVAIAILWLTLAPKPLPDDTLPLIPGIDKIGHACMFGGLAIAVCFDWGLSQYKSGIRISYSGIWRVTITAAIILFGLATEFLQELIHFGREGDVLDFGADILGAVTGIIAAPWLFKKMFKA